jgi:spore germination protein (amino acid permease)
MSIAALFTREFSEEMTTVGLTSTPISIITIGYLAVCLVGAYLGLETLARAASVTYPFVAIGIIVLLIALYPIWEYSNIFPLIGSSLYDIFVVGTFKTAAVSEIILAGVIVRSFGDYKQIVRVGYSASFASFLLLIMMLLVMILTHSWRIAGEVAFPFYRLAKIIYLSIFFQRVESIFIIIWSFIAILKIAITLYAAAFTLAESLKLPDHRPLLWPLAMILFILSFLPNDMPTTIYLDSTFLRPGALIPNYIIPILLLLIIKFKGTSQNVK